MRQQHCRHRRELLGARRKPKIRPAIDLPERSEIANTVATLKKLFSRPS